MLFLYPVLFLCSLDPKKYFFFQPFFVFFIITTIFNAQKRFLKNSPHDVQTSLNVPKLNDAVCHEGESFPAEKLPGNFAHDTLQRELVRPRSSLGFLNINPAFPTEGRHPPASEAPPRPLAVWSIDSPSAANRELESPKVPISLGIDPVWQPPHRQSPSERTWVSAGKQESWSGYSRGKELPLLQERKVVKS